jgi:maltooligosyltrehalose trehalohydrolase
MARDRIPDPQAESTFTNSKIDWSERNREPHASTLRLFRALTNLRRSEPALRNGQLHSARAVPVSEQTLLLRRDATEGPALLVCFHLGKSAEVSLAGLPELEGLALDRCQLVLTTDDRPFLPDGQAPAVTLDGSSPSIRFEGPATVILRAWPS